MSYVTRDGWSILNHSWTLRIKSQTKYEIWFWLTATIMPAIYILRENVSNANPSYTEIDPASEPQFIPMMAALSSVSPGSTLRGRNTAYFLWSFKVKCNDKVLLMAFWVTENRRTTRSTKSFEMCTSFELLQNRFQATPAAASPNVHVCRNL